jgi:antitoxin YefM
MTQKLKQDDDWYVIQETLNLMSISGMRESIIEGLATPVSQCSDKLEW